ncbi:MAG: serine/threonine protein kinase, partial [Gemmataceae bacterium]|nr:serine/threonine protein kinase [Gemmataceae bacterium]
MAPCPSDDQLRLLLDGSLGDADRAGVEDHVNGCDVCQGRLGELTGGDTVALRLRENGSAARRVTPSLVARTFLGRVRAAGDDGDAAPDRTMLFPGGPGTPPPVVAGYEVGEELGRGGMGVVWKARDIGLNRTVALKMLLNSKYASPEVRLRFLIEAEAVARLQHPGIVQVYEFGDHDGQPYLAMEYVPGGTLAQRLSGGERFAPRDAAALVARLAAAVAAAHRAGVVHRDLKPANILLGNAECGLGNAESEDKTPSGSGLHSALRTPHSAFQPKVTDFGLAKLDRSDLTRTGALMGTPQYMAPEQAAGRVREVGTPTDVYALGVILYELLTGRPPFDAGAPLDVLYHVIHTPPKPPRAGGRRVPKDLETVCLKCLEKDPRKRYASADALAADLRAYLDGRTITARPAAWWERAGRWVRRNPAPAAAA